MTTRTAARSEGAEGRGCGTVAWPPPAPSCRAPKGSPTPGSASRAIHPLRSSRWCPRTAPWTCNFGGWGVLDYIRDRVGDGQWGVTSFDDGSRNYSWDWNAVHLVQLNAWAGDVYAGRTKWEDPDSKPRATHPSGLPWLRED